MKKSTSTNVANPWLSHSTVIKGITEESPGVRTYELAFTDESIRSTFSFKPGQFNMLYLPGVGESAISISGSTPEGHLLHTVRDAGNVTHTLAQLNPGDQVGVRGAFGSAWPVRNSHGKDLIIVGGGIGIAPLRPIIDYVLSDRSAFGNVSVIFGARSPADLLFVNQVEAWSADIDLQCTVDHSTEDWSGHVGMVTAVMDRLQVPRPAETVLMTCGPEIMMRFVVRKGMELGLPEESQWVSLERNMNCAIGFCGHCQLGPEFVCRDGPVFRHDRIKKYLQVEGL